MPNPTPIPAVEMALAELVDAIGSYLRPGSRVAESAELDPIVDALRTETIDHDEFVARLRQVLPRLNPVMRHHFELYLQDIDPPNPN